jgi:hypothetical protein
MVKTSYRPRYRTFVTIKNHQVDLIENYAWEVAWLMVIVEFKLLMKLWRPHCTVDESGNSAL